MSFTYHLEYQHMNIPVKISFRTLANTFMSNIFVITPSIVPNCEPRPSANNIMKKQTDQKLLPGSSTMACVNTMNARPVPSAACGKEGIYRIYDYYVLLISSTKVPVQGNPYIFFFFLHISDIKQNWFIQYFITNTFHIFNILSPTHSIFLSNKTKWIALKLKLL